MGVKPSENSIRARLGRMEPGKPAVFMTPPGRTYHSLQREISASLSRHYPERAIYFTQRKALLVTDEGELPVACSIVVYNP